MDEYMKRVYTNDPGFKEKQRAMNINVNAYLDKSRERVEEARRKQHYEDMLRIAARRAGFYLSPKEGIMTPLPYGTEPEKHEIPRAPTPPKFTFETEADLLKVDTIKLGEFYEVFISEATQQLFLDQNLIQHLVNRCHRICVEKSGNAFQKVCKQLEGFGFKTPGSQNRDEWETYSL